MVLFFLPGCYVVKQAYYHLENYWHRVPLEEAIQNPENAEVRALLEQIPEIKKYGMERMNLATTDSYSSFLKVEGEGITYNVTASPKTELKPHEWCFIVVGCVPYKGYFQKEDMQEEYRNLEEQGLDVWYFPATAYSTLGYFADPVNSIMLRRGIDRLAEIILHEMTHETLYINGKGNFNEQLASFVGQKGATEYLLTLSNGREILKKKENSEARYNRFLKLMNEVYREAQTIYQNPDFSEEEKRAAREVLFNETREKIRAIYPRASKRFLTLNNARLLQFRRYDAQSPVFQNIWQESGEDWSKFWKIVRERKKQIVQQIP